MYRLLALHLRTPHLHLRAASAALIVRLFGSSVLFEHDPREANAWIEALPRNKYPASSNSEDDITIFLAFFDDVLSRCVKTPYKYLELGIQLYAVFSSNVSCMPSPLLMAVLEQLRHKPMDSSARQLVAAFVARLIRLVVGKMDIAGAKAVVGYMRNVFTKDGEKSPGMKVVSGLDAFLEDLESPDEGMDVDVDSTSTPAAIEFVKEAEAIVVKDDKVASMRAASKVLDWVRGSNEVLGSSEVVKLLRLLVSWSTDGVALGEFLEDLELGRRPTLILSLADDVNLRSSVLNV
jgi:nucleolar pre-ribosomal-associated protein 1